MLSVNFIAVVLAAVAAFIMGFLLHGPILGKMWMRLANIHPTGNEKMSDMYGQMFWNLVVNVVAAYVLAVLYSRLGVSPLVCAFLVWLGFNVTGTSMEVIWMKKSFKLWAFDSLSALAVTITMVLVIAYF